MTNAGACAWGSKGPQICTSSKQYGPSKQLTAAWLQDGLEIDTVHSCSGVPDRASKVMGIFSLSLPSCWLMCIGVVSERSADWGPTLYWFPRTRPSWEALGQWKHYLPFTESGHNTLCLSSWILNIRRQRFGNRSVSVLRRGEGDTHFAGSLRKS
jgi:hypothetical protein